MDRGGDRAAKLDGLVDELVPRLAAILAFGLREVPSPPPPSARTASGEDPAVWEGCGAVIKVVAAPGGPAELPVPAGPKLFCRLIPATPFPASRADMSTAYAGTLPLFPLGDYQSLWKGSNGDGAAAWTWDRSEQRLLSLTQ